ncbi:272_t:CDS:1, partial [Racocetra fulgida]
MSFLADFEPALIHHYYDRDQRNKTKLDFEIKGLNIYDPSKLTIKGQESPIQENKINITTGGSKIAKDRLTSIGHNMTSNIKPRSESQIGDYLDKL